MKTILFSLATTETAGPSAEVRVPTRKSTFSLRMSSRATRTASLASALESRMMSSIFRPSTPPLALSSSTYICAPLEAGSPKRAAGPERGIGMPTLIGFWASAPKPIKVGMPIPLSGPAALFGEPASKGAQMYVDELNAKGGVLGRKIELTIRDSKADANEAVRVARELILKENVDFLVGTLTSAEGPAVSVVAKENKIVFIAPIPKTDQLTAADKLHPYVFRVAATTTIEGRSTAEIVAKWPVTKIATIAFDYAYGQDVTKAFVDYIKKIKPSVEIVDQEWPKL